MLETLLLTTFATKSIAAGHISQKSYPTRYLRGIFPPITCSTLVLAREGIAEVSIERIGRGSNFEPGEAPVGAGGQIFRLYEDFLSSGSVWYTHMLKLRS